MNRSIKTACLLFGAVLFFAVSIKLQNTTTTIHRIIIADEDRYYLPPAKWLRVFSSGYNELAAHLVWIKTIVYFGKQIATTENDSNGKLKLSDKAKSESDFTVDYLSTAAKLDPKFRRIYTMGGALTLFQKGQVTLASINSTIELLRLGLNEFPNDGELVFGLGFMHYYEMEPLNTKEKNDPKRLFHKQEGTRLIRLASELDGAPPYAGNLASSLMTKQGGFGDLVIEHLKAMLLRETNEKIRRDLVAKIRKELGKAAERDIKITEDLLKEWQKEMHYIPYDLYLVLRPQILTDEVLDPLYWSNRLLGINHEESTNDLEVDRSEAKE